MFGTSISVSGSTHFYWVTYNAIPLFVVAQSDGHDESDDGSWAMSCARLAADALNGLGLK